MLVTLGKSVRYRSKRFYRRLSRVVWQCQDATRAARNTIRRIVRMMRLRPSGLDVRPGVGAELALDQRSEGQQHLSGDQETNRRLQKYRLDDAGVPAVAHDS
jgi:hypothetical protein